MSTNTWYFWWKTNENEITLHLKEYAHTFLIYLNRQVKPGKLVWNGNFIITFFPPIHNPKEASLASNFYLSFLFRRTAPAAAFDVAAEDDNSNNDENMFKQIHIWTWNSYYVSTGVLKYKSCSEEVRLLFIASLLFLQEMPSPSFTLLARRCNVI